MLWWTEKGSLLDPDDAHALALFIDMKPNISRSSHLPGTA